MGKDFWLIIKVIYAVIRALMNVFSENGEADEVVSKFENGGSKKAEV